VCYWFQKKAALKTAFKKSTSFIPGSSIIFRIIQTFAGCR
jgi:hypothetical protein